MKEMLSMVQLFQDFSPDPGNWGFGNNSENEFENRFGNGFENESANEFKTSSEMNLQIRLHRNHP